MINIYPIQVPGYVISFVQKEIQGVHHLEGNDDYSVISIEPNSIFGMFFSRLLKNSCKVKEYRLLFYTKNKTKASTNVLEYHKTGSFNADLSFDQIDYFFKFIDSLFRQNFFFFVKGFCLGKENAHSSQQEAINIFIDKYDLLEYGYSYNQLRRLYYSFLKEGSATKMKHNYKRSNFI